MTEPLSIGYSPCPNDTYIFHALMHGHVPLTQVSFAPPFLEDVETLNRWALKAKLDVTKLSFHTLGHVLDQYVMLTAGAALGRGCGPLLVAGGGRAEQAMDKWTIAIPGAYTTAAMLLRLYAPRCVQTVIMRFDGIMDAVARGRVDAGVIIHESRFTYQEYGLECIADLGAWWEEQTGLPIPLGCIAARRNFSLSLLSEIDEAIRKSILFARSYPEQCLGYIKEHAQELNDKVIRDHIGLYVNTFSLQMGEEGSAAVEELLRRGRKAGIFPQTGSLDWPTS